MKLNLGCGIEKRKGWLNCDISKEVRPDLILDIEDKLPFDDNDIEEVYMSHILEHIINFIPVMHEIWRVCDDGAKIIIKTPFYSSWGQYNDPTHVRFFTPFTFNYFQKGTFSHEVKCKKDMFKVEKVIINFGVGSLSKLNFIINPLVNFNHTFYCRFFAWIIPCAEICYKLRVVK